MNDQGNIEQRTCSASASAERTNLFAREKDDDFMVVALEKERVLLICFGMLLSEVILRWRIVIDINTPFNGVISISTYDEDEGHFNQSNKEQRNKGNILHFHLAAALLEHLNLDRYSDYRDLRFDIYPP